MQSSRVVTRCLGTLVMVAGPLVCPGNPLLAQEPARDDAQATAFPPEQQRELDELLTLTVPQQKIQAEALIKKYPGTELANVLRRLLAEYETFERIQQGERQRREARTAWGRAYWQSRCCPLPPWTPPVGRIVNETGEPVLYEQQLEGLHRSRWSGPYRLTAGNDHASPYPYLVRYLVSGSVRVQRIVPGDVYAFRGSPEDGTLELAPSAAAPAITPDEAAVVPSPAPPESDEPAPALEAPMIAP